MISFEEAGRRVLDGITPVAESAEVAVTEALGRVLAHSILAPFAVPNHDNSAMDGYGVRFQDLAHEEKTTLTVVADLPAGSRLSTPLGQGEAVRIMTGAPIPEGCDCVVMQEEVERQGNLVTIPPGQKSRAHIRPAGEDLAQGSVVLERGRRLGPADLGLLASLGLTTVPLFRRLRVALLSTGNEVIVPGDPLAPGQVYDSNRTALRGALTALGVEVIDLGLVGDDRRELAARLDEGSDADALITTGGVSVGDHDLVKEILAESGAIHFWKVAMKPGKPQAYGRLGRAHFFGLPGNPVSGLVVYLTLVKPALLKLMGAIVEPPRRCRLPFRGHLRKKHGRLDFTRGRVHFAGEEAWVESTGPQGSGILSSLSRANALIILPEGPVELNDGDTVTIQWIDYD
ncbi:MAG: molybdopterin molybdotransferase MoeA [Magnetococcales bacterium]|nr:molybdopterin molybdotransferase MoeA [Magnetococcales bacterium]